MDENLNQPAVPTDQPKPPGETISPPDPPPSPPSQPQPETPSSAPMGPPPSPPPPPAQPDLKAAPTGQPSRKKIILGTLVVIIMIIGVAVAAFLILQQRGKAIPEPVTTPTPTLAPTPLPTLAPSPSASPGAGLEFPEATTSADLPAGCNQSCQVNADCPGYLICSQSNCRNPSCPNQTDCLCDETGGSPEATETAMLSSPSPSPTPTPASTSTSTLSASPPTELPEVGFTLPTFAFIAGSFIFITLGLLLL